MGLEIYNSLSDEKKIYLNTEDLLIELKYDVANAEKPLAVDISFTENDEVSLCLFLRYYKVKSTLSYVGSETGRRSGRSPCGAQWRRRGFS